MHIYHDMYLIHISGWVAPWSTFFCPWFRISRFLLEALLPCLSPNDVILSRRSYFIFVSLHETILHSFISAGKSDLQDSPLYASRLLYRKVTHWVLSTSDKEDLCSICPRGSTSDKEDPCSLTRLGVLLDESELTTSTRTNTLLTCWNLQFLDQVKLIILQTRMEFLNSLTKLEPMLLGLGQCHSSSRR